MNRAFILGVGAAVALSLPAMAASELAVGANAVVPDGAPLPLSYQPQSDAACDGLGTCGLICPNSGSVFIGDFAFDIESNQFIVVDVVSPDGVFRMDSDGCGVGDYASYAGVSQRGCGYDNDNGVVYTASWNDQTIWQLDSAFNVLGSQNFGESFAGLAVDEANTMLYACANASPDELIEYSILSDGSVAPTGSRWKIPWQTTSDGFSAASLEFDDCSETFMLINQDSNSMEYFQLAADGMVGTGACSLPVSFGWGFGLDFADVELEVADIAAFACDFPIETVEPDEVICGGGEVSNFTVRWEEVASAYVGRYGGPVALRVRNNTQATADLEVWATLDDRPGLMIALGSGSFPVGASAYFTGYGPLPGQLIRAGDYAAAIHVGKSMGGTPAASTSITVTILEPGVH